ncbi:MAG: hypothetical protein IPN86_01075 [Saprospiraceae bacterium]|jgi:hypothetical protein|nr:hypothetical protein [Saprospiraceae bacterium]
MTHGYTENQIIQFIYKECDLFDRLEMEFAMEDDSTILESYSELLEGFNILPKVTFSPKKSTLSAILAYSVAEA